MVAPNNLHKYKLFEKFSEPEDSCDDWQVTPRWLVVQNNLQRYYESSELGGCYSRRVKDRCNGPCARHYVV